MNATGDQGIAMLRTGRPKIKKNTPKGIRIPVCSVKGSCPRPLDDGGNHKDGSKHKNFEAGNAIRTRDINLGKVALYH